jgi:uncharacterized phage-associated protein
MDRKISAFQYVLHLLLNWYESETGHEESNDLSILKALKLLFFVTAADIIANKEIEKSLLLTVFDRYHALPLGHVESDVYDVIQASEGALSHFLLDNDGCTRNPDADFEELKGNLDYEIIERIESAVKWLQRFNKKLIVMEAFQLVDLSHQWYSWQRTFADAQASGSFSRKIDNQDIIREKKYFDLMSY